MNVKITLNEKQMRTLEASMDCLLRSEGLRALPEVVDLFNAVKRAEKVEDAPIPSAPTGNEE